MNKIIIIGILFFLPCTVLGNDPIVKLKSGMNEVVIKVQNKSNLGLESINVVVKEKDLPEGISFEKVTQDLNVSAKSKSDYGLVLKIKVDHNAEEGVYTIPFLLKDKEKRTWSFKLAAEIEVVIPHKYDLLANFPNPFNPDTKLKYFLENVNEQETKLIIYDVLGKPVKTLVSEKQAAGEYTIVWDGKDDFGNYVSSGLYFYKLTSGSFTKIKKMTLLK